MMLRDSPVIITSDSEVMNGADYSQIISSLKSFPGPPLSRNLDYSGIARKMFLVEPMPQGAIPYYLDYLEDQKDK